MCELIGSDSVWARSSTQVVLEPVTEAAMGVCAMGRQLNRQFELPTVLPTVVHGLHRLGRPKSWAIALILGTSLGLGACSTGPADKTGEESEASLEDFEGDLVFEDVNLSRADDDGQTLWTVKAEEARYSRDRKKGQLKQPKGKLYQDGEVVYEVSAKQGFVEENGITLRLAGDIKIKDVRDKSTFEGQTGAWQPQSGVFDLQGGIVLKRGGDRLTAKSGQAFSKEQNFILKDKVTLVSLKDKKNPTAGKTELKADELTWQMKVDQVDAIGSTRLNQTEGASKTALQANRLVWQRKEKVIQALGQARVQRQEKGDSTELWSQRIVWQQKPQVLDAQGPARMKRQEKGGSTELWSQRIVWQQKSQVLDAQGQARVRRQEKGGGGTELWSQRIVWQQKPQVLEAQGQARLRQTDSAGQATDVRAKKLVWQQKPQVLDAQGNVVAIDPGAGVRVKTERAILQQKKQLLTSNARTLMEQYDCSSGSCVVGDRAESNRVDVNLKERVVFLRGNAAISLRDPALDATSESMTWYVKNQRLIADQPVTVVNKTDGVVLQGNYGDVDMKSQVANLVGNVRGRSQRNQSRMRSQRLFWAMKEKQVQLVGNVFYQQASPPLTSTGDRATAAIKEGQFVLLAGPGQRARTTFVTEETQGGQSSESEGSPSPAPGASPVPREPLPIAPPPRPGDLPAVPRRQLLGR